jgi:hypothetical protein
VDPRFVVFFAAVSTEGLTVRQPNLRPALQRVSTNTILAFGAVNLPYYGVLFG